MSFSTTPSLNEEQNLAYRARYKMLTVQEVNRVPSQQLQQDKFDNVFSVLDCACMYCPMEVITAILNKGVVDINEKTGPDNGTPLMAAAENQRWDVMKLLINRGANGRIFNKWNRNVLHFAAENGAPSAIVEMLVNAGADPQAKDIEGLTPVDLARHYYYYATAAAIEKYCLPSTKSANFIA
jgi:ankyrin repeat protein